MPDQLVTTSHTDGITTITMDDGKVNAWSVPMLRALHAALDDAERDDAVVLLEGRPGCFSAGFDLRTFAAGPEALHEMLTLGAELTVRLLGFPRPVVVAATGTALAAGTFPLLAADVRLLAAGPYDVGLTEVRIGLTVPTFVVELAQQRLHPAHLPRAVTCATRYQGQDAVTAGFADALVTPEDLPVAARAAAAELTQLDRDAHAATKLRLRGDAIARIRAAADEEFAAERFGLAATPARA